MSSLTHSTHSNNHVYEVWQCTFAQGSRPLSQWLYNFRLYGIDDVIARLDYSFWVLRSQARTVVVDTGCTRAVAVRRGLTWFAEPDDLLVALGISSASVTDVLITHLHYDHAGNTGLFPVARVACHEAELRFWTTEGLRYAQCRAAVEVADIEQVQRLQRQGRLDVLTGEEDSTLPGVRIVRVGGHSPGQLALVVETRSGPLVLASDAAHLIAQVANDWPFGIFVDLPGTYRALARLRQLSQGDAGRLVPGHEPTVRARATACNAGSPHVCKLALG